MADGTRESVFSEFSQVLPTLLLGLELHYLFFKQPLYVHFSIYLYKCLRH